LYTLAKLSNKYVAFQRVETSLGMIRGGKCAAATAARHAGRAMVVEFMMAKDSFLN
jgi:hypothetical protein